MDDGLINGDHFVVLVIVDWVIPQNFIGRRRVRDDLHGARHCGNLRESRLSGGDKNIVNEGKERNGQN